MSRGLGQLDRNRSSIYVQAMDAIRSGRPDCLMAYPSASSLCLKKTGSWIRLNDPHAAQIPLWSAIAALDCQDVALICPMFAVGETTMCLKSPGTWKSAPSQQSDILIRKVLGISPYRWSFKGKCFTCQCLNETLPRLSCDCDKFQGCVSKLKPKRKGNPEAEVGTACSRSLSVGELNHSST